MAEKNVKIAVPSDSDKGLDAHVITRFGRCPYFTIVTIKDGEIDEVVILENPGAQAMGGAGPLAVQTIANEGIQVVLGAEFGPNAEMAISQSGIKAFGYPSGAGQVTVKEIIELYLEDKLPPATNTGRSLHGGGMGMGRGMGRGGF